jgi:hypothetical protein
MPLKSPPSVEAVAAFIESIHILHGISEEDLFGISERLEDTIFKAGDVILETEQPAENFYIIYSGKVDITREDKGQKHSRFSRGDYFGVDVFFDDEKRNTKVTAKTDVLLLTLPKNVMDEIPGAIDFMRNQLEAFLACRELLEKVNFDWIENDEAIYFVVNKHPILFWQRAVLPILLVLGSPFVIFFGMWYGAFIPLIFSGLAFIIGGLWLLWNYLDWGNDYYIVTNQRVIWLEKIIGIFDSRQEAHLGEVKSVDVNTDVMVQSVFDYGHINVNTIFGSIALNYTPWPRQAHLLIEELWQRSKVDEQRRAKDRLHQAIRDQIREAHAISERRRSPSFTSAPAAVQASASPAAAKRFNPIKIQKKKKKKKKKAKLFTLRYEEGSEIIYRKHIVVLFTKAGMPALMALVLSVYFLVQLVLFFTGGKSLPISYILLVGLGAIGAFGWMAYQYADWSNDIFKVSENKIFDIDRKPFGDVQSRSSELKNIESTEYRREGLFSVFFNYGTVYIHIGSEEFEFEDVLDPAAVQQDINHRYKAIQERARLSQEKKERDDMIKWLVAYHESTEDIDEMIAEIRKIKRQNAIDYEPEESEDEEDQDI